MPACVQEYVDPCIDDPGGPTCMAGTSGTTDSSTTSSSTINPSTSIEPTLPTTDPTTGPSTTVDNTTTMDPTTDTDSTSDSDTEDSTTDVVTCLQDPVVCLGDELSGERCKSVGESCYKCTDGEGGCSDCDQVDQCLGDCLDGVCSPSPCYLEDAGVDSCPETQSCIGTGGQIGICGYPRTCADLYDWGYRENGMYWIDVDEEGPLEPFEVECDMGRTCGGSTGGWTKLSVQDVVVHLGADDIGTELDCDQALCCVTQNDQATDNWDVSPEISEVYGPHARHQAWDNPDVFGHTCRYTFKFPYREFAFEGYGIGGSCPDDKCVGDSLTAPDWLKSWTAFDSTSGWGNIHFGNPDVEPTTSVAEIKGKAECFGGDGDTPTMCTTIESVELDPITTMPNNCYNVGAQAEEFRILWGEFGKDAEGWAPWYSGKILFR